MLMARSGASVFGMLVAVGALACPRTAAAWSCAHPRLMTPALGAVPSNGLIWDVCYRHSCPPPTLTDSTGRLIELVVDQQVQSERYERVLTAYRPSEALVEGDAYRLESDDEWFPFSNELNVVEADVELPRLPELKAIDFLVRSILDRSIPAPFNARFTFEPFEGNLVVDPEGLLENPFEGLEFSPGKGPTDTYNVSPTELALSRPVEANGDRIFFLAKEHCYINFNAADWGAPASVRFGVLDFAGNFSGWSEPVSIEFPTEVTEYPVVMEPEGLYSPPAGGGRRRDYNATGACSMTSHQPSRQRSAFVFLLAAAGLLRRARSRLERA
jgi:hypothetical protein